MPGLRARKTGNVWRINIRYIFAPWQHAMLTTNPAPAIYPAIRQRFMYFTRAGTGIHTPYAGIANGAGVSTRRRIIYGLQRCDA